MFRYGEKPIVEVSVKIELFRDSKYSLYMFWYTWNQLKVTNLFLKILNTETKKISGRISFGDLS